VLNWYDAPEYDRNPMFYPDNRGRPQARVGTDVQYIDGRWRSTPIRVYVGPAHF
jgi:hypothetical protein